MDQLIHVNLSGHRRASFRFIEQACFVVVEQFDADDEFRPGWEIFSDGCTPVVGRALVQHAMAGGEIFDLISPDPEPKPMYRRLRDGTSVTRMNAGSIFRGLGRGRELALAMAHQGPRWWLASPANINHPLLNR